MLAASLNRMLERSLERSPRARELCAGLEGRRLRIVVRGMPACFEVSATDGRLEATLGHDTAAAATTADVTLTGSPLALLAMVGDDARAVVERDAASLEGDEQLAQQFQQLARLLRPDLEQALGGIMGRVPAHFAVRGLRMLERWSRDAGESLARNGADYLAHESRDLVPRAEAEAYLGGVEALRARLAEAERRTAALAERLATLASGPGPTPRDGA